MGVARDVRASPPAAEARPRRDLSEVGTFKDNKRAPIHRWFQYPAGFSYRAVEHALRSFHVGPGQLVYDPFAGTGTTLVAAKWQGVRSLGAEAHPLVAEIARTKVDWTVDLDGLGAWADRLYARLGPDPATPAHEEEAARLPELVRKCYSRRNLRQLLTLREQVRRAPAAYRSLSQVALIGTLRGASAAATGWPYIAPKKRIGEREAVPVFEERLTQCLEDLRSTPPEHRRVSSEVRCTDARGPEVGRAVADLAFTSPPYLNNYDYADRLRLESYFLGLAGSWGEITRSFRSRLIVAATTQVTRGTEPPERQLGSEVEEADPRVAASLRERIREMDRRRRTHRGHKSYDLMAARYFTDMTRAIAATRDVLRPGASFVMILGDSAPYGVHVPTEEYLGRIGVGLGFRSHSVLRLRARGEKWRANPQRHHVPLRESWLVLRG